QSRRSRVRLPARRGGLQVCLRSHAPGSLPRADDRVSLRVAVLSVHTCPLAALGGKETGGMNVYVRETARELGRMGVAVDVFTRSQNPAIPRGAELGEGARVIHLPAGPQAPMPREVQHRHLADFVHGIEAHRWAERLDYDVVHAHHWLSGVAGPEPGQRGALPLGE